MAFHDGAAHQSGVSPVLCSDVPAGHSTHLVDASAPQHPSYAAHSSVEPMRRSSETARDDEAAASDGGHSTRLRRHRRAVAEVQRREASWMVDVSDVRNPANRRGRLSNDRRRCLLTDTSTLNKTCYKTKNVSFLSRCNGPPTSGLHPRVFDEFKPVDALSALEIPLSRSRREGSACLSTRGWTKPRSSWILSSPFLRRSWTGIDRYPHISREERTFDLGSWRPH